MKGEPGEPGRSGQIGLKGEPGSYGQKGEPGKYTSSSLTQLYIFYISKYLLALLLNYL